MILHDTLNYHHNTNISPLLIESFTTRIHMDHHKNTLLSLSSANNPGRTFITKIKRYKEDLHFFLSNLIVRFLLLSKIYLNLYSTNPICLTISSGLGFSRNFIVFITTLSNSLPRQCAASI